MKFVRIVWPSNPKLHDLRAEAKPMLPGEVVAETAPQLYRLVETRGSYRAGDYLWLSRHQVEEVLDASRPAGYPPALVLLPSPPEAVAVLAPPEPAAAAFQEDAWVDVPGEWTATELRQRAELDALAVEPAFLRGARFVRVEDRKTDHMRTMLDHQQRVADQVSA